MKKLIFSFVISITLFSCSSPGLYYWGKYESTYYNKVNKPGDESNSKHLEELKKIITKTEKSKKYNIGPGIYAEYGYYLLQQGKRELALPYFEKEKKYFPEGTTTINFIIK